MKNASPPLIKANRCRSLLSPHLKRLRKITKLAPRSAPNSITVAGEGRLYGKPPKMRKSARVPRKPTAPR
jgi:hypothetical protein